MTRPSAPGLDAEGSRRTQPRRRAVRRRPGPQTTRAAILEAGRKLFIQRGFAASLREIAVEAKIDHALVYRHFGSKTDLFGQIFDQPLSCEDAGGLLDGNGQVAHERISDLVQVAVRSASDPTARTLICDIVERRVIPPLACALGGAEAENRARLLLALAAGVEVVRDTPAAAAMERDDMRPLIAKIVREILSTSVSRPRKGAPR
ncbi:TetR family transcriptional regulator [Pseudomonas sp. ODNR1LW]|nr:TetR family transcriptional regulator [Pseudomonas sp. ODNR1LW]